MAGELLNSLTELLPQVQCAFGRVTYSNGTPSLASQSGSPISDQAQLSVTDTNTGVATIVINNFGDSGQTVLGFGTSDQQNVFVSTSIGSWSNGQASVIFNITRGGGDPVDANFKYLIVAYPTS